MDMKKMKEEAKIGIISREYIDYLKIAAIGDILAGGNQKAANALCTYAHFLNRMGIDSDNYPLYLKLLASNNKNAVDALLEGHEPEKYLGCVVANAYIVKSIFNILASYRKNEIYGKVLRVLFGVLMKMYESAQTGYRLYKPTIADVNSLGKILDESKDQDDDLNRDVLDILMYLADLDTPHETDPAKKEIARQAGRIRSDFFDNKRRLNQSITDVILAKADKVTYGIPPEYTYT
jgi:hypothetical protein